MANLFSYFNNTTNNIPILSLKKKFKKLTKIDYIFENQWLQNQPINNQINIILKITRANLPLKVMDSILVTCIIEMCRQHYNDSSNVPPSSDDILNEKIILFLRNMQSILPIIKYIIIEVEHFKSESQNWICKLLDQVLRYFTWSIQSFPILNRHRIEQNIYNSDLSQILSKCNNVTLFREICKIHSVVLKSLCAKDLHYRTRIFRRHQIDMIADQFVTYIIEKKFEKADVLFLFYKRHLRTLFLNYIIKCDKEIIYDLIKYAPHIIEYIKQNLYKLELQHHVLCNILKYKEEDKLIIVKQIIASNYNAIFIQNLIEKQLMHLTANDIHQFLQQLSHICKKHIINEMIKNSSKNKKMLPFINKYPKYIIRIICPKYIEHFLNCFQEDETKKYVFQDMIISPSLCHSKRIKLLTYYDKINCDLLKILFNKLKYILQSSSTTFKKQNKCVFYNKQCFILLTLPFTVPNTNQTLVQFNELAGIISEIFFLNNSTSTIHNHKRINYIKHIALYIFCVVLFNSVPPSLQKPIVNENENCAICNENMLCSEKTYILPCKHRMHNECLCNLIQYSSTSIHKYGLPCPYCNTNNIPLYMNYITELTSEKDYTLAMQHSFTSAEKMYNGSVLRLLKLICDYY